MTAKMQLGEGDGSQHSEVTGTQQHVMFCIEREQVDSKYKDKTWKWQG